MATKPVVADLVAYLKLRSPVPDDTCAELTDALCTAIEDVVAMIDNTFVVAQGAGDITDDATWPWRARRAVMLVAARYAKRPSSPEGVAGFGELGVVRVTPTDPDVQHLLGRFLRVDGFA